MPLAKGDFREWLQEKIDKARNGSIKDALIQALAAYDSYIRKQSSHPLPKERKILPVHKSSFSIPISHRHGPTKK